jgi:cell division protein ZapB
LKFVKYGRLIADMSKNTVENLYKKVDQLINHCESLKARESSLLIERSRLIEKNELARTRVEAMIGQLKNLQDTTG